MHVAAGRRILEPCPLPHPIRYIDFLMRCSMMSIGALKTWLRAPTPPRSTSHARCERKWRVAGGIAPPGRAGTSRVAIAARENCHGRRVRCRLRLGRRVLEGFSSCLRTSTTGMPPESQRGHWLPAPNGIHFHSPTALYVDAGEAHEQPAGDVVGLLVRHDLDDINALLVAARGLSDLEYRRTRLPGSHPRSWDGPDESIAQVLRHLVVSKEPCWLPLLERPSRTSLAPTASPNLPSGTQSPALDGSL